ncbi:MAG: DNA cytosine methyltransferase [Chitinophagaceae bacterium]|nr:DNA cytosine methyltransferase [Chitinophagaceae bacterium]
MKVLDTFAGAGGFSLGFDLSGHFNIIGAIEFDKWAADTFQYNHPNATTLVGDIQQFDKKFLLDKFQDKPDIILGGPPCQGYSIANRKAGDASDPRNSLFKEFIRLGEIFEPEVMIMENVPNLIKAKTHSKEFVIDIIINELENLGYNVDHTILSATDFGVPQIRKRLVVIASKQKLENPFPQATHSIETNSYSLFGNDLQRTPTLWDAISDLPQTEACQGSEIMDYITNPKNEFQKEMRGHSDKVYNHVAMKHSKRMVERFASMSWGHSVSDVPEHLKPIKRNGNGELSEKVYDQNNRRMFPDKQCHTIAASFYANFVHPYKNRNFTPREGARIQTFPDWYVFKGKPTVVSHKLLQREGRDEEKFLCQYNQIGNAVPPLLAKAIALNLYSQLSLTKTEKECLFTEII